MLSASLDPKKSWFALNAALCGGKPSRFCSFGYAWVFPDEYRQIQFDYLFGDNGVPTSASWFSADGRQTEKVYVASAFGLVLGTLRQKSLDEQPFIHSEDFQMIVSWKPIPARRVAKTKKRAIFRNSIPTRRLAEIREEDEDPE